MHIRQSIVRTSVHMRRRAGVRRVEAAGRQQGLPAVSTPPRGSLIAVEGGDRAGKGSQVVLLQEALQKEGVPAVVMTCPDRSTAIGRVINDCLVGKAHLPKGAMHLLFAANRWERCEELIAHLLAGTTVIFDRYAHSGVAYSSAQGLGLEWCKGPEAGLPAPDLVVFLQLDPAAAAKRADFGAERYESIELQELVVKAFEGLRDPDCLVVDAAQDREAVHAQILPAVLATLQRCREGLPIRQLWDKQPLCL